MFKQNCNFLQSSPSSTAFQMSLACHAIHFQSLSIPKRPLDHLDLRKVAEIHADQPVDVWYAYHLEGNASAQPQYCSTPNWPGSFHKSFS